MKQANMNGSDADPKIYVFLARFWSHWRIRFRNGLVLIMQSVIQAELVSARNIYFVETDVPCRAGYGPGRK